MSASQPLLAPVAAEEARRPVVAVEDLRIAFPGETGEVVAVDGLSFTLSPGAALGLVGESGSGKSATALALLGLHRGSSARVSGRVEVAGVDLGAASAEEVRRLRGRRIAMIFQDPLSALDPYYSVGDQIAEVCRVHTGMDRRAAWARAVTVLDRVGIPSAARRARSHPHEFSGGMRQRAMIAMALACEPDVLVADEPTTALDVTVQAQILDLLHELREESGMALLLVTHDLGVAAGNVDDVLVMHAGVAVERGPVGRVLSAPTEPYTRELVAAVPRIETPRRSIVDTKGVTPSSTVDKNAEPLVRITELRRHFRQRGGLFRRGEPVRAVDGVSLGVLRGETLGIVGESGSGKTTLARMMVRLLDPTSGTIHFDGHDLASLPEKRLRPLRRDLQMVFQDPASSLNPRRTVGDSIADPLRIHGADESEIRRVVAEMMERVGLDPARRDRYPHEFSGGQRQRVGIARALVLRPRLLVCDEPVSALDVSTQSRVVRLLADLKREFDLTLVFVAHDLALVRQVSDRVAVMRAGQVVEIADSDTLYENPEHPYTRALLAAVPRLDPEQARAQRAARRAVAVADADHAGTSEGAGEPR
ncbi:peptide/nickel transport system ATP-binding protein [Streptoalloteichus tenebrarius]|uniref:Peptide/nickel transport system ATP-binding protein n=1 Tax=Streptoalloteichus tenebrarius (strain ATCC 17920 / DSM 40477 / JCM 4838 / CBS 697.72 / NBRC 16177 / NCIMB 11028 / NRRL B-12390 / A12253. 1 / ISP 5477) TaxID=1933 RepID=A0ABT1HS49_STRSD|nr:ABC transporter ATP-binding protein [Streptoalloteichus tenebrarius]MCP2258348.1 peptide/nickel transport system ATP-binding protein [Streptoalloteichus tenebrarius]